MHLLKTLTVAGAVALLSASFAMTSSSHVFAAAPECVGSTSGGPKKFTCTDDLQAKLPKTKKRIVKRKLKLKRARKYHSIQRGNKRFKVKTIPCYQNPVPGCRD